VFGPQVCKPKLSIEEGYSERIIVFAEINQWPAAFHRSRRQCRV
jgi:hypothetical protein